MSGAGFRWIRWARELHLGGRGQAVVLAMATHADKRGHLFVSHARLAAETGCHRATVMRAVEQLAASGHITRVKNGGVNHYQLGGSQLDLPGLSRSAKEQPDAPSDMLQSATSRSRRVRLDPLQSATLTTPNYQKNVSEPSAPRPERTPRERFFGTKKRNEQVAAVIDACREIAVDARPHAGHLGKLLKQERPAEVWRAIERMGELLPSERPAGDPAAWIQEAIRVGRNGHAGKARLRSRTVEGADAIRAAW